MQEMQAVDRMNFTESLKRAVKKTSGTTLCVSCKKTISANKNICMACSQVMEQLK